MSECETVVNKSYFNNQQSISSRKCLKCKEVFEQEYHNQRFCRSIKCRNKRHVVWQTEYRQRKKARRNQRRSFKL